MNLIISPLPSECLQGKASTGHQNKNLVLAVQYFQAGSIIDHSFKRVGYMIPSLND